MKFAKTHAASQDEIKDIVSRFVHAAGDFHHASYDGMQLHSAHVGISCLYACLRGRTREQINVAARSSTAPESFWRSPDQSGEKPPSLSGSILGIRIDSVESQNGGFSANQPKKFASF